MSECLLEFTGVRPTWSLFSITLLKSGIMLNTPIEPVSVVAFEKILSQPADIQYPPDAA